MPQNAYAEPIRLICKAVHLEVLRLSVVAARLQKGGNLGLGAELAGEACRFRHRRTEGPAPPRNRRGSVDSEVTKPKFVYSTAVQFTTLSLRSSR